MQRVGQSPGSWRAKHDRLPPELAAVLYAETQELATRDSSPVSIARRLSASHALSLSPGTIRHWMVGDRKLQRRNVLNQRPSPDLSYVIGANVGDGCALTNGWCVKLEVTDNDFAKAFNTSMARVFSRTATNKILVRYQPDRLPLYIVKYSSKPLVKLLRLPQKKLLEIAFAFPREFLRGFFDAEGHVDVGAVNEFRFAVGAENSDRPLLSEVSQLLWNVYFIASRINRKRKAGTIKTIQGVSFKMRKTSYSLLIRKFESVKRFYEQVGFSIERKTRKLEDAIKIFEQHGRNDGVAAWNEVYSKQHGEWVRRARTGLPPNQSG